MATDRLSRRVLPTADLVPGLSTALSNAVAPRAPIHARVWRHGETTTHRGRCAGRRSDRASHHSALALLDLPFTAAPLDAVYAESRASGRRTAGGLHLHTPTAAAGLGSATSVSSPLRSPARRWLHASASKRGCARWTALCTDNAARATTSRSPSSSSRVIVLTGRCPTTRPPQPTPPAPPARTEEPANTHTAPPPGSQDSHHGYPSHAVLDGLR